MTRVALAGLGGAVERIHLPALRRVPNVEIVGGMDIRPERRQWAARQAIPGVYDRMDTLLEAAKPDVVVIATPPDSHAALAIEAVTAGCHVFCEKPFVMSVAEADAVIAAAERAGRVVAVNNQYRQMLIYRKTRAAIARGLFGKPYLLQIWQQMNLPPDHDPPWRAAMAKRILFEFATHALDLSGFLLSASPAAPYRPGYPAGQPYAVSARTPYPLPNQDADYIVVARLDYPGERAATLVFNRRSQAPQRYLEMRLDCEKASLRISLGGVARFEVGWSTERNRPRLRYGLVRGGEARVERNGTSRALATMAETPYMPATAIHFRKFLEAIRDGRTPEGSARAARELIRTVFAAYDSAERGGALVRIDRPLDERARGAPTVNGAAPAR